jgi:hypothetical protein
MDTQSRKPDGNGTFSSVLMPQMIAPGDILMLHRATTPTLAFLYGVIALLGFPAASQASEQICKTWFKQGNYAQAARCFRDLVNPLEAHKTLTAEQKLQKGVYLRNAAFAMSRAAKKETSQQQAAYMREQAIQYLDKYLRESLYSTKTQKRYATVLKSQLHDKIGYTTLTVTSRFQHATITVTGFHFKAKGTQSITKQVRPGTYSILVQTNGKVEAATVKVKPLQPAVVRFPKNQPTKKTIITKIVKVETPKAKPIDTKLIGWIVLGTGLALVAGGGAMFGLMGNSVGARDAFFQQLMDKPSTLRTVPETQELKALHTRSEAYLTTGIVMGSIGLVATGIGAVVLLTQKPKAPAPPPKKKK